MKLIQGGRLEPLSINNVEIAVSTIDSAPFPVEVMVFEEDTHLILTVDQVDEYKEEHPIRIMTDIMDAKKYRPGSIVRNGNSWYAVVVDLDREPICDNRWVEEAIKEILNLAEKNKIFSLALPILGSVHGGRGLELQLNNLLEIISEMSPTIIKRILIITRHDRQKRIHEIVRSYVLDN